MAPCSFLSCSHSPLMMHAGVPRWAAVGVIRVRLRDPLPLAYQGLIGSCGQHKSRLTPDEAMYVFEFIINDFAAPDIVSRRVGRIREGA